MANQTPVLNAPRVLAEAADKPRREADKTRVLREEIDQVAIVRSVVWCAVLAGLTGASWRLDAV